MNEYLRAVTDRVKSKVLFEFLDKVFSVFSFGELLLRFQREAILDCTSSRRENEAQEGLKPFDEEEDRLTLLEPKLCDDREAESFDRTFDRRDFSLFLAFISFTELFLRDRTLSELRSKLFSVI